MQTCVCWCPPKPNIKNKVPHISSQRPWEIKNLFISQLPWQASVSYLQKEAKQPPRSVTIYLKMSFLPHSLSQEVALLICLDNFNYSFPTISLVLWLLLIVGAGCTCWQCLIRNSAALRTDINHHKQLKPSETFMITLIVGVTQHSHISLLCLKLFDFTELVEILQAH